MDLIDLWWNASQQSSINELRANLTVARRSQASTLEHHKQLIQLLQDENEELRLRVGVLIRLLIQQGAISAETYGNAVNDAKLSIAIAKSEATIDPSAAPRPKPPKIKTRSVAQAKPTTTGGTSI